MGFLVSPLRPAAAAATLSSSCLWTSWTLGASAVFSAALGAMAVTVLIGRVNGPEEGVAKEVRATARWGAGLHAQS